MRQLSEDNGLSHYCISDIEQDDYGFIWISTYDGLNRYDGARVKTYRKIPGNAQSLSSNRVKCLLYDNKSKRLLVGTDGGGINEYDYTSDSFKSYFVGGEEDNWLPQNDVTDIRPESQGRYWILTRKAVYLAELDEGVRIIQTISYPVNRVVNSLVSLDGAMLTIAKKRTTRYLKRKDEYVYDADIILPDDAVNNSTSLDAAGRLFFSTTKGIYSLARPKISRTYNKETLTPSLGLSDYEDVSTVLFYGSEMYYVINGKGLYRSSAKGDAERLKTGDDNYWRDNTVKSSVLDGTNTMWIGSLNKGIRFIDLEQTLYDRIDINEAASQPFVSALMLEPDDCTLWVGTSGDGLWLKTGNGRIRNVMNKSGSVTDIEYFRDGTVKIVYDGYLYSFEKGEFRNIYPLSNEYADTVGTVFNVCEDVAGTMWLGCRKGIVGINGASHTIIKMETSYHSKVIPSKYENALWVCNARTGLYRYELGDNLTATLAEHYTESSDKGKPLRSNTVMTLLETGSGDIYVGTEMGMNYINPKTLEAGQMKNEKGLLSSCRILAIQEDSKGMLWVNTSKGIVRYNPLNGEEKLYGLSDGMVSNYTTEASAMSGKDIMYVGTNIGLNTFFASDERHSVPPKIAITGLKVFGKDTLLDVPVMDAEKIVLSNSQKNIMIELSVFSYSNPQKNTYSYRLLGFNDQWITTDVNAPYALYSKLKKGHYTFEFKGGDGNQTSSEEMVRLKLIVKPAWWDTLCARLIYLLIISAVIYFVFSYLHEKIKHKAEMEANEAKIRFYANITHELRTPLTLISAPLSELASADNLPRNIQDKISIMQRNAERLMDLANHFLELRKLDSVQQPLHISKLDVTVLLDGIAQRFKPLTEQKKIRLSLSVEERPMIVWLDKEKLTTILINLLSNAIKFTEPGGNVSLTLRNGTDGYCVMEVRDNGCGISQNDLSHIFERFYQVEKKSVSGTGIELELVKSLAELHKGWIKAESKLGEGSVFILGLPAEKRYYSEDETAGSDKEEIITEQEVPGLSDSPERSRILIVEDDVEMQTYLKSILEAEYEVLVSDNGKSGVAVTLDFMPDLVVSDVMMPIMDGFEMCKIITDDFRTSHIPVILLTAKNDETAGLRSGAVDFITKPFIPNSLLLKIKNLLRYRESHKIDSREQTSISQRISEYKELKEKLFLEKAYDIVETNIDNEDFRVDDLIRELGISKTQLHKKMTTLTEYSPSGFIRNIRLDKANELLHTGKYSIKEVIFSVGFNSPSYFAKTFKERFGVLPSDLLGDNGHVTSDIK